MFSEDLIHFLIQLGITAFSLWVASFIFVGIRFANTSSLIVAALLLGFGNAVIRPLLVILTLPLTLLTLGLFVLVINALILQLVAVVVRGFVLSGFWTAFFVSLLISIMRLGLGALVPDVETTVYRLPTAGHTIAM